MSNASQTTTDHTPLDSATEWGSTALRTAMAPVRFLAFWTAVALPFLYVPLLFDGLTSSRFLVFVVLVAINVVALVVGHNHRRH